MIQYENFQGFIHSSVKYTNGMRYRNLKINKVLRHVLKLLSCRQHIRSLPGCRFLQNAAGCLPPANKVIIMQMRACFLAYKKQVQLQLHLFCCSSSLSWNSWFCVEGFTVWGALRNGSTNRSEHNPHHSQVPGVRHVDTFSHFLVALGGFLEDLCRSAES